MKPRLVILASAVVVLIAGCQIGAESRAPVYRESSVAADQLLRRDPYMGIACPRPNASACDRIGLFVALREPAARVTADIAGQRLVLDDPGWSGSVRAGERKSFAGFLQPAGLRDPGPLQIFPDVGKRRWIGKEPVSVPVTLSVEGKDESQSVTEVEVGLSAGWG